MIVRQNTPQPFDFDGLKIRDYTSEKETSSSLAVVEAPPGTRHQKAYSKRSDKYYYLVSGKIRFTVDEESYELEKGDLCLIEKGQRFSYENVSLEKATLLLFHTPSFDLDSEVFIE